MLRSSLVGKMRVRDRLVDALALSGNERVLDAGCGLGLALIGCAKKLTTGTAVGIDLWAAHLSDNNPDAARANAVAEGVADRVEVETGDLRKLPFADASFDAIISMTVIHNIPSREGARPGARRTHPRAEAGRSHRHLRSRTCVPLQGHLATGRPGGSRPAPRCPVAPALPLTARAQAKRRLNAAAL